MIETDYLVLGSGLAGLYFALRAAEHGRVVVVTKRSPTEANTHYAQGGVAGVLGPDDSARAARRATRCGWATGCASPRSSSAACARRPSTSCTWPTSWAWTSTATPTGNFALGREGGHSARRIVHAQDMTGAAIQTALLAQAAERGDRITLLADHMAIDLLTTAKYGGPNAVFGAYVYDQKTGEVKTIIARAVVLATGGAGKVYLYTSNPDVATGDGVAMAYRVGARVANMEFFQFHPTCLYHPQAKSFLISEALRGEGGILRLRDGTRVHGPLPRAEGPRPARRRGPRHRRRAEAHRRRLRAARHDPPGARLPGRALPQHPRTLPGARHRHAHASRSRWCPPPTTAAAASLVDSRGRTSVRNLYAIGEVVDDRPARRLPPGLELAARGAGVSPPAPPTTCATSAAGRPPSVAPWYAGEASLPDEAVVVSHNWDEIRRLMWNYVGIVRTDKRLERARRRIELIREEIREYYWNFLITGDLLELRNLALVADLIIESARRRHESRGLHYNLDHPDKDPRLATDTVLGRGDGPII